MAYVEHGKIRGLRRVVNLWESSFFPYLPGFVFSRPGSWDVGRVPAPKAVLSGRAYVHGDVHDPVHGEPRLNRRVLLFRLSGFGSILPRMTKLDHEKLDAYRLARDGVREVELVLARLPRGHAAIADQFRRASQSVCLNIAEGAGTWLPREKARFYRIARASATECTAVLDYLVDIGKRSEEDIAAAKTIYSRVTATLVKLAMSMDAKSPVPGNVNPPVHVRVPRNR